MNMSNPDADQLEESMIKAWSFSRHENFSKCKFRAKLLYIDKLEEPQRPLREGQTEQANDRGTRVHEAAELYVKGGVELLPELRAFAPEFIALRDLYAKGKVSLEGEWAHDKDWMPVAWKSSTAWLRLKLDALVHLEDGGVLVVDYKSGRRSGNELKHAEQIQLYTLAALLRYPDVPKVTTELWYTDQDDLARVEYTREQGMKFFKRWNERGLAITEEVEFPPNPNKFSCQWCRFGPKGSNVCKVGV